MANDFELQIQRAKKLAAERAAKMTPEERTAELRELHARAEVRALEIQAVLVKGGISLDLDSLQALMIIAACGLLTHGLTVENITRNFGLAAQDHARLHHHAPDSRQIGRPTADK